MVGKLRHIWLWLSLGWRHKGLVLDVGSGDSPHPRADILCDRYLARTGHRHEIPLVRDRPLVCADISTLPFQTQVFDFVFCRHVLEHVETRQIPAALGELMRVAKGGYVEAPSPSREMLMPDPCHKSFVEVRNGVLVFTPKRESFPFQPVARLLLQWKKTNGTWRQFLVENPSLWTTSLRWQNEILYRVEAPRLYPSSYESTTAELCSICDTAIGDTFVSSRVRRSAKTFFRWFFRVFR